MCIRDCTDTATKKIAYGPIQPAYKDFLAEMAKWYAEGLIDKEYIATDGPVSYTHLDVYKRQVPFGKTEPTPEGISDHGDTPAVFQTAVGIVIEMCIRDSKTPRLWYFMTDSTTYSELFHYRL